MAKAITSLSLRADEPWEALTPGIPIRAPRDRGEPVARPAYGLFTGGEMMKRLFLVLSALLVGASSLAAAGSQTIFHFNFPKFAAVFTNVTDVYFFGSSYSQTALGPDQDTNKRKVNSVDYYAATGNGLAKCIDDNLNLTSSTTVTVQNSAGTDTFSPITCYFAPNQVTKSGFTVIGYNSPASPSTDGELLIITNTSDDSDSADTDFVVWPSLGSSSPSVPFGKLQAYPGYVKSDNTLSAFDEDGSSSTSHDANWVDLPGSFSSSSPAFTNNVAFYTNYSLARVIPLVFRLKIDNVLSLSASSQANVTIVWNAAAP